MNINTPMFFTYRLFSSKDKVTGDTDMAKQSLPGSMISVIELLVVHVR